MGDEKEIGEEWTDHYRGTRYHYSTEQIVWWQTFKDGFKVRVTKGHEKIIKELLSVKSEGGTFRVTENGDIITKILEDGEWKPVYVCKMGKPFAFDRKIDTTPQKVDPGDLWPGFYDGARYSYLVDKVWWKNPDGPRQYVVEELPHDVMNQLRMFRPSGGSFRITEHGYAITLIPKQPLRRNVREQWERMSDAQQRLLATKVENTEMLPIYIGRLEQVLTLKEPKDYSQPLSDDEREKMLDFLAGFSSPVEFEGMAPKSLDEESIGEEFQDDPEDWQ